MSRSITCNCITMPTRMLHTLKNMFEDRLRSLDKHIKTKIFSRGGQSHLPQSNESTQSLKETGGKRQLKELWMKYHCLDLEVQRSRVEVAKLPKLN
jgi:hypothetical protein